MNDELHTENPELDALFERYRRFPGSHVFAPLADACRKAGMLEEAIEICEKGVSANPGYASGFVVRGKCYYDIGNADQAEASFEKVLELDPNNLVALKYLGLLLVDRGQPREARERFERILAIDPDDREISAMLTELPDDDAAMDLGAELEDEIVEVLADEPVEAELRRAEPGADDAEPVELREVEDDSFRGAEITLGGGGETPDVLATMTLADIYASQGYRDKAVRIYREILESAPGNEEVRTKLAELGVDPGPRPERETADTPGDADVPGDGEPEPAVTEESPPADAPRPPVSQRNATHFRRWLENLRR